MKNCDVSLISKSVTRAAVLSFFLLWANFLGACKQPVMSSSNSNPSAGQDEHTNDCQAIADTEEFIECVMPANTRQSTSESCTATDPECNGTANPSGTTPTEPQGEADSIVPKECETSAPALESALTLTVLTEALNVRAQPSTEEAVVSVIHEGTTVTAFATDAGDSFGPWYCVNSGDATGWVASNNHAWLTEQ